MKKNYFNLLATTLFFFICGRSFSQVSFSLTPALCSGNSTTVSANAGTLSAMAYSWAAFPSGPVFSAPSSSSTSITFPSAGTFTIGVGILTSNGFDYTTNTIVINQTPALTLTASDHTVCAPLSSTLTASGASNYSWSPSLGLSATTGAIITSTPNISTIYTLTGSNAGCSSSSIISIIVVDVPNGMINTTASSVCPGSTATITASGATSFSWTSSTFTGVITTATLSAGIGTYTVIESNGDRCFEAGVIAIGLADCTGISEINNEKLFNAYPNPFKDQLYIHSEADLDATIELMMANGNLIRKINSEALKAGSDTAIDLSTFSPGIYFLKITASDGSFKTSKLVKE